MGFEFFFGIFGLIATGSKSHHRSRLENDWRLFTPLSAESLIDTEKKSTKTSASASDKSLDESKAQKPIFNITGTLSNTGKYSVSEGVFSSSSSASSISSSGSKLTKNSRTASTETLIKQSERLTEKEVENAKKYELYMRQQQQQQQQQQDNKNNNFSNNIRLAEANDFNSLKSKKLEDLNDEIDNNLTPRVQDENEFLASTPTKRFRTIYCRVVCTFLWLCTFRLIAGLLVDKSLITIDFYYLGVYRIHLLVPLLCVAIQAAAVSLIFIRNNEETNWLVPFYSSKDYLIRSRSNFRPKMEDYNRRINFSITLALIFAFMSSLSIAIHKVHIVMYSDPYRSLYEPNFVPMVRPTTPAPAYYVPPTGASTTTTQSPLQIAERTKMEYRAERVALAVLLVMDIIWAVYSTYICFLVAFYFNLISSIMKNRFWGISKIIEDLAESNTTKTTNQARKITTLYLEHNEACELLDESNDFWQYPIFFTYFTYIPAYCYCLYNLFFVEFDSWPSFLTWAIHCHTAVIILLISFSAAGVSTEIATFLHRVRGLTIGYSCYDLFAITNASMSNTAAACASYFLIVADFSRSSVFNMKNMNGSITQYEDGSNLVTSPTAT